DNNRTLHIFCLLTRQDDRITDKDFTDFDKWSETYNQHGLSWQEWKNGKHEFFIKRYGDE
ncbi:hypothetical protein, partial [Faecalibaculum rodentium]|uniref:hypothetical protein n=1 Tax=Faecalibaculum rodentium TaxID=1702221 RepID=UPI0025AC145E